MNAQQEMQPNTKDNILLITTDQQRFDTINAWGNQSIFTALKLYGSHGDQLYRLLRLMPDLSPPGPPS